MPGRLQGARRAERVPSRGRGLAGLLLGALLTLPSAAHAQVRLHLDAFGAVPATGWQADRYALGGSLALGVEWALQPALGLTGSVGWAGLAPRSSGQGPAGIPALSAGGLGWIDLGLRLRPLGRSATGAERLFVEVDGGVARTGSVAAPMMRVRAGWSFAAGPVDLGPWVGWTWLPQTDALAFPGDAHLVLVGIGLTLNPDRPPPPPPPPPPPAAKPISLSKVSLDKPGQAISLEKRGSSFGEISVNLNWSRGKKGFFGGSAIDLDLGCLFEMADGNKSVVQALGRMFGGYHDWPYIALDGDDRSGDVSSGETMRINGAHWPKIKRIAIFANIYDGAPNWNTTDGVVTVTMPDQPPIEVRMTEGRNDKRLCGVVLLENVGGSLKASRIVDYFRDQSELDRAFGWGLNWRAGSKD